VIKKVKRRNQHGQSLLYEGVGGTGMSSGKGVTRDKGEDRFRVNITHTASSGKKTYPQGQILLGRRKCTRQAAKKERKSREMLSTQHRKRRDFKKAKRRRAREGRVYKKENHDRHPKVVAEEKTKGKWWKKLNVAPGDLLK